MSVNEKEKLHTVTMQINTVVIYFVSTKEFK